MNIKNFTVHKALQGRLAELKQQIRQKDDVDFAAQ